MFIGSLLLERVAKGCQTPSHKGLDSKMLWVLHQVYKGPMGSAIQPTYATFVFVGVIKST